MFVIIVIFASTVAASRYPFRDSPLAKMATAAPPRFIAPIATTPGIDERYYDDAEAAAATAVEHGRIITLLEKQRQLNEWKQVHLARIDIEKRDLTPDPWRGIWETWKADGQSWEGSR